MKTTSFVRTANVHRFLIVVLVALLIGGLPLLACAFSRAPASASVAIVNNSNLQFKHAYFSPVEGNNWGPDQLNDSTIGPGMSHTLSTSCSSSSIKVILEDQNGCFLYKTVSCSDNTTWTVTNDSTPDCGN